MKKGNKIFTICTAGLISAVSIISLSGCGGSSNESTTEATQASATTSQTSTQSTQKETRTITDIAGRQVEIPAEVTSVACPGLAGTRLVIYAGGLDKLTGVSENEKDETLTAPCTLVNMDKMKGLKSVASGWPNFEMYQEEMVALDSDVIVYYSSEVQQLDELQEQTKIPVIGVKATDFTTDDFRQSMKILGEVLDTKDRTDELISYVDSCITDLDNRTKDIPDEEKPSVYFGAVGFKGYNGIEGTYAHYIPFEAIHAKNVADETGGDGAMIIEKEKVTEWDPDILFLTQDPPSLQLVIDDYKVNAPFYKNLKSVQNGQVYAQGPYNMVNTNIEVSLINAYYAGTIIYPEQFKDIKFEDKEKEILTEFLGEQGVKYLDIIKEQNIDYVPVTYVFEE